MKYINKNEFEKLNIIHWHKNGYTGKGIKIANFESANIDLHFFNDVRDPFNIKRTDDKNFHGNKTLDVITQVAPNSEFHILSTAIQSQMNKPPTGKMVEDTIPYLLENNIHLINASLIGTNVKEVNNAFDELQKQGTVFVTSAGNSADKGLSSYASSGLWISVGAVGLNSKGKVSLKNYSSIGEGLVTVSFSGLHIHDSRKGKEDRTFQEEGTSFSSPLLCGMLALVQQFFIEKTGRALNQTEMIDFIKDNSIDLGEEGKDIEYGHGLFVLPDPEDINVNKYLRKEDDIMDFKDVDKDRWSVDDIELVSNLKLMEGYPDGNFKPTKEVTREELATVTANLIRLFNNK